MGLLTVKLPQPLQAKLDALVARRGRSRSDLVREAIERLVSEGGCATSPSALDIAKDLKGVMRGPKDLSTNPKYLRDFGR